MVILIESMISPYVLQQYLNLGSHLSGSPLLLPHGRPGLNPACQELQQQPAVVVAVAFRCLNVWAAGAVVPQAVVDQQLLVVEHKISEQSHHAPCGIKADLIKKKDDFKNQLKIFRSIKCFL